MKKNSFTASQLFVLYKLIIKREDFSLGLLQRLLDEESVLKSKNKVVTSTALEEINLTDSEIKKLFEEIIQQKAAWAFESLAKNPHVSPEHWKFFLHDNQEQLFSNFFSQDTENFDWRRGIGRLFQEGNIDDSIAKYLIEKFSQNPVKLLQNPNITPSYRKKIILETVNQKNPEKFLYMPDESQAFSEEERIIILGALLWESLSNYKRFYSGFINAFSEQSTGEIVFNNLPRVVQEAIKLGYVPQDHTQSNPNIHARVLRLLSSPLIKEELVKEIFSFKSLFWSSSVLIRILYNKNITSDDLLDQLLEEIGVPLDFVEDIAFLLLERSDIRQKGLEFFLRNASFDLAKSFLDLFPEVPEVPEKIMATFSPLWCKTFLEEAPLEIKELGIKRYENLYGQLLSHQNISLSSLDTLVSSDLVTSELDLEEKFWASRCGAARFEEVINDDWLSYGAMTGLSQNPFLSLEQARMVLERELITVPAKEIFFIHYGTLFSQEERESYITNHALDIGYLLQEIADSEQLKKLVEGTPEILREVEQDHRFQLAYMEKKINFAYKKRVDFLRTHPETFTSNSQAELFYTLFFQEEEMDPETIFQLALLSEEKRCFVDQNGQINHLAV